MYPKNAKECHCGEDDHRPLALVMVYPLPAVGCSAKMPVVECRGVEGCQDRLVGACANSSLTTRSLSSKTRKLRPWCASYLRSKTLRSGVFHS